MAKIKSVSHSGQKSKHRKRRLIHIMSHSTTHRLKKQNTHRDLVSDYKEELLKKDKREENFDKLFEQKLAQQYKDFRNMKETHTQTKRLIRVFVILITVILIALLLISYS